VAILPPSRSPPRSGTARARAQCRGRRATDAATGGSSDDCTRPEAVGQHNFEPAFHSVLRVNILRAPWRMIQDADRLVVDEGNPFIACDDIVNVVGWLTDRSQRFLLRESQRREGKRERQEAFVELLARRHQRSSQGPSLLPHTRRGMLEHPSPENLARARTMVPAAAIRPRTSHDSRGASNGRTLLIVQSSPRPVRTSMMTSEDCRASTRGIHAAPRP
jgi:hypothetical protein